jgi:23S rRNA U2552 (ribose-2'-O)-methylase RlmE/FtsJ
MPIFDGYDTDKGNPHTYETPYQNLFEHRRKSVTAVLELGIYRGGSLRAWRDYFPNAEIVGVDIDHGTMMSGEERIRTICGDVSQAETLSTARNVVEEYDLIVDDASHRQSHQYFALHHLWQSVKVGGIYIIEDLDFEHTFEVLTVITAMLRGQAEITIYLGDGSCESDDMLIIERLS